MADRSSALSPVSRSGSPCRRSHSPWCWRNLRVLAQDALERIEVSYDVERPVVAPSHAQDEDAPQIWPEAPRNIAFRYRRGDAAGTQAALASAAHVVEIDLVNNRVVAAAMEPRTAIGVWDESSGRYRLPGQRGIGAPHPQGIRPRPSAFRSTGSMSPAGCRRRFGMKNVTYPEYALVLWAARRLGAPVRWVAERIEDFTCGVHGRDNLTKARLALDSDGAFSHSASRRLPILAPMPAPSAQAVRPPRRPRPWAASTTFPSSRWTSMACSPTPRRSTPTGERASPRGKLRHRAPCRRSRSKASGWMPPPFAAEISSAPCRIPTPWASPSTAASPSRNLDRALAAADHSGFPARRAEALTRGKLRGIGIGCFLETSRGQPNEEAWVRLARTAPS